MSNYIVAGVGVATAYETGSNPKLILTSTTLQEESMSLSVTAEDIRGGMSNPILGRYFHDSLLEATLTDALFDMNYIALNAGGDIATNNDSLVTESVVVGAGGTITVTGTPVEFGDGLYGWVSQEGSNTWTTVTFVGQTATLSTLTEGETVCVKYNSNDVSMKYFTIPSSIIPSIVHMVMTYPLFPGGMNDEALTSKTQVGELIIDIPKFQFNGSFDMSLTSSGAATSNLSGQALASYKTTNCESAGQYADIKMKLYDTTWYDSLTAIYIEDAEFTLKVNDTKTLSVYGVYSDGTTGFIPNTLLTMTSDTTSVATVASGVVTGKGAGTAHIEVKPTAIAGASTPPEVAGYAEATVTSA